MVRDHRWRTISVLVLITSFAILAVGVGSADSASDEPFDIEITGANETVTEGDILRVEATVTNTGNAEDSQQIHLKNGDSEIVDSVAGPPVTLTPGESQAVTLSWETANGDTSMQNVSVQSNTDKARQAVDIQPGAFYDISIEETDAPVTAGESMNVVVNTTNVGNASGMTGVSIGIELSVENRTIVQLQPGETEQVTLSWDSTEADIGERILTATTVGAREQAIVMVERTDQSLGSRLAQADSRSGVPTPTSTSVSNTVTETSQGDGSGFGIIVSLLTLLSTVLFVRR